MDQICAITSNDYNFPNLNCKLGIALSHVAKTSDHRDSVNSPESDVDMWMAITQ